MFRAGAADRKFLRRRATALAPSGGRLHALIAGFQSTAMMGFRKRMALRQLTMLEITAQAVGLAVVIAWAAISPSIWALVAGGLSSNVVSLSEASAQQAQSRQLSEWMGTTCPSFLVRSMDFRVDRIRVPRGPNRPSNPRQIVLARIPGCLQHRFHAGRCPSSTNDRPCFSGHLSELCNGPGRPREELRTKIRGRRISLLSGAAIGLACLVGSATWRSGSSTIRDGPRPGLDAPPPRRERLAAGCARLEPRPDLFS